MEEHNKTEMCKHLNLCRKKIANIPRLEEEVCTLKTKLDDKEASRRELLDQGIMPAAPEDTVLSCKRNGFRIKVEHFHKMFPCSFINKWISPVFKADEWHFVLYLYWNAYVSNASSRSITFSLKIVEGPLCSAVRGNGVHLMGEIAVLDVDFKNHLMSPQVFQVEMLTNSAGNNWDTANTVALRNWTVTNTIAQANSTVICHLNIWQVSCHHKLN
jgi:hypothetical protein